MRIFLVGMVDENGRHRMGMVDENGRHRMRMVG